MLEHKDMKIYQVGGAVRDKYLGLPCKDKDWVVVGATPEMLLKLGYTQVGRDFPVFLHPITREEYALARTERKTKPGYTGFNVYAAPDVSLRDDLQRRDLTINAMALDEHGQLFDPFNGLADLRAGILRQVSPAFVEDPVRILRIARFAARFGFRIADDTLTMMIDMVKNGEVDALVAERVWQETERALQEKQVVMFFDVLKTSGALERIFPNLKPNRIYLQQARQLTSDTQVLFAVLMSKLSQKEIESLCQRYCVPNQYRDLAIMHACYHQYCHRITQLSPETVLNTLHNLDAFRRPKRFKQFLLACEATHDSKAPQHFHHVFELAQKVDVTTLLADGFKGMAISEELRRRRLDVLAEKKEIRSV